MNGKYLLNIYNNIYFEVIKQKFLQKKDDGYVYIEIINNELSLEKVIFYGLYDVIFDVIVFIKYFYKFGGDGDLIVILYCKLCLLNYR